MVPSTLGVNGGSASPTGDAVRARADVDSAWMARAMERPGTGKLFRV